MFPCRRPGCGDSVCCMSDPLIAMQIFYLQVAAKNRRGAPEDVLDNVQVVLPLLVEVAEDLNSAVAALPVDVEDGPEVKRNALLSAKINLMLNWLPTPPRYVQFLLPPFHPLSAYVAVLAVGPALFA